MNDIEILECLRNRHINDLYKGKSVSGAITRAIQVLQEKAERENPKPLTLEELKNIKNPIPLYKKLLTDDTGEYVGVNGEWWDVCCGVTKASGIAYWRSGHTNSVSDYGKTWIAYDHEPKEATDGR